MNETDEFLLDAFKQQGIASDDLVSEIRSELDSNKEMELQDKEAAFMDSLLEKTGMEKSEVLRFLSAELNMDSIDLSEIDISEETFSILQPDWAKQYEVVPLSQNEFEAEIIFANPLDPEAIDTISQLLGKSVNPKLSYRSDVLALINEAYGNAEETKLNDFFEGMEGDIEIGDGLRAEDVSEEDAPIIKYVHSVIKDALENRASDIHMSPLKRSLEFALELMVNYRSNQILRKDCNLR